jgi:hypothetical protein
VREEYEFIELDKALTRPERKYSCLYSQEFCRSNCCFLHHYNKRRNLVRQHIGSCKEFCHINVRAIYTKKTYKNHSPVNWHISGERVPTKLFPRKPLKNVEHQDLWENIIRWVNMFWKYFNRRERKFQTTSNVLLTDTAKLRSSKEVLVFPHWVCSAPGLWNRQFGMYRF